jgi:hypothetical protein
MVKSIIQNNKECYFCGSKNDLHEHHIYPGRNRNNSEKYGLKIWLCSKHHNMSNDSVHFNSIYMKLTKIIGQLYFNISKLDYINDDEFLKIFKRNYK